MAETFDCPKCGAPINFEPDQHINQQTMPCPYCGESIIIPANLRPPEPTANNTVATFPNVIVNSTVVTLPEAETAATVAKGVRRAASGALVVSILVVLIICAVTIFTVTSIRSTLLQTLAQIAPANQGAPVQPVWATVGPKPTDAPTVQAATPTPTVPPAPTVDTTATAQIANNTLLDQQSNWPVLLQEKFLNNQRNWDVGSDTTDLAVESYSIAGGKYTWKITSKNAMGTFTFPDMAVQTDLYISADIQMTTASSNPADQAGIIFRHSSKDNTFWLLTDFKEVAENGKHLVRLLYAQHSTHALD